MLEKLCVTTLFKADPIANSPSTEYSLQSLSKRVAMRSFLHTHTHTHTHTCTHALLVQQLPRGPRTTETSDSVRTFSGFNPVLPPLIEQCKSKPSWEAQMVPPYELKVERRCSFVPNRQAVECLGITQCWSCQGSSPSFQPAHKRPWA